MRIVFICPRHRLHRERELAHTPRRGEQVDVDGDLYRVAHVRWSVPTGQPSWATVILIPTEANLSDY